MKRSTQNDLSEAVAQGQQRVRRRTAAGNAITVLGIFLAFFVGGIARNGTLGLGIFVAALVLAIWVSHR